MTGRVLAGIRQRDNVLMVHWHDLGRCLGAYGHTDVSSPGGPPCRRGHPLHQSAFHSAAVLAVTGITVHRPLPAEQWLVGLAHHGWEYRAGVRTLPQMLSGSGWYSALFGMQHETSYPKRLGSTSSTCRTSYCDYV